MGGTPMRGPSWRRHTGSVDGSDELFVDVRRGPYAESVHRVAGCVVTSDGERLLSLGDADCIYPIRSLAKPFLARILVQSGAYAAFELGDVEIALCGGSHDGAPDHVAAVRKFLQRIGVSENALLCGAAFDGAIVIGPPARNNCSGKHAAVLALCRHFGYPIENYIDPEHPIQRYLIPQLRAVFGKSGARSPIVVDGCGMPVFGASLADIAKAYAMLGIDEDSSARRVREAFVSEPAYVGGWTGNRDTQLIAWSNGAILAKIGAEGLHADALVDKRVGLALKVRDGNSRALSSALYAIFKILDVSTVEMERLVSLKTQAIMNASGTCTGEVNLSLRSQLRWHGGPQTQDVPSLTKE